MTHSRPDFLVNEGNGMPGNENGDETTIGGCSLRPESPQSLASMMQERLRREVAHRAM